MTMMMMMMMMMVMIIIIITIMIIIIIIIMIIIIIIIIIIIGTSVCYQSHSFTVQILSRGDGTKGKSCAIALRVGGLSATRRLSK